MGTTLTLPASDELQEALDRRAADLGITVPELIQVILTEALTERPMSERVGHLKGCLNIPEPDDEWRREIKERNWRRV